VNAPSWRGAYLTGVSCSSTTACTAVGEHISRHGLGAVVERWDGLSWARQHMRDLRPGTAPNVVSCAAARACMAVGGGSAERWNGSRWSRTQAPPGLQVSLEGVSCVSARACTAVGNEWDTRARQQAGVALRWNGAKWRTTLTVADGDQADLAAVSCVSLTFCVTVGSWEDSISSEYELERWNGVRWSSQNSSGLTEEQYGVSCASRTACSSVGTFDTRGYADRWNGSAWRYESKPRPAVQFDGAAVSCTAGGFCAVATDTNGLTALRS
jgi:hypothetical protein